MNSENLYVAEVISNTDPKKQGRVKIYIESIMSGWSKSHLPYARGFTTGGGSNLYGLSNIPEVGSKIWVFSEKPDLKKNWYYLAGFEEADINPHLSFINLVGSSSKYPNFKFMRFKNGVTIGVDSSDSNPEVVIQHSSSASIFIDKKGEITIKGDKLKFKGDVKITGKLEVTKEVTAFSDSTSVTLSKHVHISGAPGLATTPPTVGT